MFVGLLAGHLRGLLGGQAGFGYGYVNLSPTLKRFWVLQVSNDSWTCAV